MTTTTLTTTLHYETAYIDGVVALG